jgi:hypothetical protein
MFAFLGIIIDVLLDNNTLQTQARRDLFLSCWFITADLNESLLRSSLYRATYINHGGYHIV